MHVDVARVPTAWKAATLVAGFEQSTQRRRDMARFAVDIERLAVLVFNECKRRCV
jgi:hypothetical protein